MFQSTRPRGARRNYGERFSFRGGFQSTRPRGARRLYDVPSAMSSSVSIHAPAWGATDSRGSLIVYRWFQSTRPRGARHQHTDGMGEK